MTALQLLAYIATAIGLQCLLAIAILIWRKRTTEAERVTPVVSARTSEAAWDGLRAFQVTARTYEDLAHTQCTLALATVDKAPLPPFKPGQFLTFSLAVDGPDLPTRVTRCYSLSDTPDPDQYRITVKRALAPPNKPDAPGELRQAGCTIRCTLARFWTCVRHRDSSFSWVIPRPPRCSSQVALASRRSCRC